MVSHCKEDPWVDELNFLGSIASPIELIGMTWWKRNRPSFDHSLCCVVALQRAGPGREPAAEVQPNLKEVLLVCSGYAVCPLRARAGGSISSAPCLIGNYY